jgi:hypothetical protein
MMWVNWNICTLSTEEKVGGGGKILAKEIEVCWTWIFEHCVILMLFIFVCEFSSDIVFCLGGRYARRMDRPSLPYG